VIRWPRSLTLRLGLLTGAWVTGGLALVWLWTAGIVADGMERVFDARLSSLLDALVVATNLDGDHPYLTRPVSEPRFDQPLSGVYYQIQGPDGSLTISRSLWDQRLPEGTFGHHNVLVRDLPGPRGQHLRMMERDILMPGNPGLVHVLVAISRDETMAEIARASEGLAIGFGVLGAGLVGAVVVQVLIGLKGLRRLSGAVADLRAGHRLGVDVPVPAEVQPLVVEIDALVQQNRDTVERARGHVGNLAHALRTRLSVLRNALATGDIPGATHELAEAEHLVQHHLARARAGSLSGSAASDVPVLSLLTEVRHALLLLFADRPVEIVLVGDPAACVRCERSDLAEMLGNLMENACKWGHGLVRVTVVRSRAQVVTSVSDDGPGLPEARLLEVRERGVRLDESVPGSGLGLAITADLAALYGGSLTLDGAGPDGGLAAHLALPAATRRGWRDDSMARGSL
jgi:signal transduction histidine kinase